MNNLIDGKTGKWEIIIGLEIHAQILSNSKLFSNSSTKFGLKPNTQVSLVDAAMPGMLPVINEFCIKQAVKTGLGLKAKINKYSVFDRKNYFYADLPQGYQISQYKNPIVGSGEIQIDLPEGKSKSIGITRLHLEQDAGKSLHDQHPEKTYVDLNRSGIALMEIVSEPDLRSSDEVALYIQKIRSIMRYLGTCDGNMQEGSLRADINVSVRKPNEHLGTRCEIKNLNSIKFIKQAIEFESRRQIKIIEEGGQIEQNTMLFDSNTGTTRPMRNKEEAHDYRYFPDPDLQPIIINEEFIKNLSESMPELPDQKKQRYINEYSLSTYDASLITSDFDTAVFFEKVLKVSSHSMKNPKLVCNWIISELYGYLKKNDINIHKSPITPDNLSKMIGLIIEGKISGKIAKNIFEEMFYSKKDPTDIIKEKKLEQISDEGSLKNIINQVLEKNTEKVLQYKSGKDRLLGFFVGEVMKLTDGKANPSIVNKLLKEKINK